MFLERAAAKERAMTTKHFFTITLFFSLLACAPQAELVKTRSDMTDLRDDVKATKGQVQDLQKRLNTLDTGARADLLKSIADYGVKSDQLATDIQLLQGKLEENNFRISEIAQKLDDKSVKIAELSARVEALETRFKPLSGVTTTAPTKQAAAPKTVEPSEVYRQAKNDFDKGNYDLALAGFQNYIAQFPNASMADKAQYWTGECYYAKKDFGKAIEAFSQMLKTYPKSDKAAGAKLKIGFSYLNEKNTLKAREYLNRVVKEHPSSDEAALARERLKKLRK
jgi:tol-pal system protein YbgF